MKKILTLVVALVMVIPMMAIGRNDGSTKANAIDFDWEAPMTHAGGTLWYVVNLDPLYEEETPALNLFLANKDAFTEVHTSLKATVAGQTEEKSFTIGPKQQKVWSANATMLVRLKQKEIYLTLTADGPVMMSARVFEAADLDETCKDALNFSWTSGITKPAGVPVWYKLNIKDAKANTAQDVCVVVTNNGTSKLTLYANQSLDCPSSGVTKRTIELEAGQTLRDTVPNSMLRNVAFDELYVSIENDQPVTIKAEYADRPLIPVLPVAVPGLYVDKQVPDTAMHKNDTTKLLANQTYYFRYNVTELNALKKYEPEFTFRNIGTEEVSIDRKMSFEVPAYTAQGNTLVLAGGEESVEVIAKNTLLGLDAEYIYVKIKADKDIELISRFKHIREGKACKTNIDFNWDGGHRQDAKTTQWYAIDLTEAKANVKDVVVYVENQDTEGTATVKASMAFSCPYIDLQEVTRKVSAGSQIHRRMAYSTYAMMSDTIYIGLETDKDVKFWATLVNAEVAAEPDTMCLRAVDFNWKDGAVQNGGDTVWYLIDMTEVRELAAKFPTVFVQNLSSTNSTTINAELSLECPDSIKNESRSLTIAANGSYTKQLSRNMFENIKADTIYLRVISTENISLQIRLTEEAEGASCASAIPFNWVSGNKQAANANLWYIVDLREVMKNGNDIRIHLENKDNTQCKGVAQLIYECPTASAPSIQDFTLAGNATKSITLQNSAFEMVEDSAVYVNLQGTTSLRIWAEILPVAAFDTIFADGLTLIPLQWDTLYTQSVDTAWYIIPKSEIDMVRNLEDKVKPVAHLINLSASKNTIKAEAAFAFPIGKKMMTKSQEVKGNKHFTDTIPSGTFDQLLKKDSVILRVTRPVGSGDFQFRAELVKAFSGNRREDALPIRLGETYTQGANSEMWYKLNTADLKKDKTLYDKILWINSRNVGAGDAKVNAAVYEGLLSDVDLLEEYGLNDYRERTIKKGQGKSHNFPAQAIYGVGDIELYIKIRTTDSLVFETKFKGTYAPQAVDPKQAEAKLVVPNVEYTIPGDNQEHWYMVCLPYLQNNYIYTDGSKLEYELNGTATIEVTSTFQDEMNCAMPVRKRTINKSGGYRHGSKPLRELIEKAIKKTGHTFDFSGTAPEFMDSLLHRFITNDSVTFYVRIKSDKELKAKLITPQITGDACTAPMAFDWEHGNVNPAGDDKWYHVVLDSVAIPDTCDLRLHVDNWEATDNNVQADLYFDCNDPATKSQTYTLGANGKDSIDIDRDLLVTLGWADMIINYSSDKVSHIWAELIPNVPRDTLCDTIRAYVCQGGQFEDTITGIIYDPVDYSMTWTDTVTFQDGVTMKDSLTTFFVYPLVVPEAITVDSMKKLNAAPLLVQGMQLFVDSSSVKLTEYYRNIGNTVDTIINVDTVYWAEPVYDAGVFDDKSEAALDLTKFYEKTDEKDTLALVIKGAECGFVYRAEVVFPLDPFKYAPKNDTICPPEPAKNPDTLSYATTVLDTLNLPRYVDTVVTYYTRVAPTLYTKDQLTLLPVVANDAAIDTVYTITSLKQQFEDDATDLTMAVTDIKWKVYDETNGWVYMPYTVAHKATLVQMRYEVTTECGTILTSDNINFTLVPPCDHDTIKLAPVTACDSYVWSAAEYGDDQTYVNSGVYYYDDGPLTPGSTCHQFYELTLTIKNSTAKTLDPVTACDSYYWADKDSTITTSGTYTYVTTNVAGCDSVVTLQVTINNAVAVTATPVEVCDRYNWTDAAQAFDTTIVTSGTYVHTFTTVAGCDSVVTLQVTINNSAASTETPVEVCDSYYWASADTTITTTGVYTHIFQTIHGCDSVVTLSATINNSVATTAPAVTECNMYTWKDEAQAFDTLITKTGTYTHVFATVHGCDSTVTLNVTINVPYQDTLDVKGYYGDRIIMINRNQINSMPGWEDIQLDSLDNGEGYVKWYMMLGATPDPTTDTQVAIGYYYTLPTGEPLPAGSYYAVVDIPASTGAVCGAIGTTEVYVVGASAPAPALVPTLARPGEDIRVINLDPEMETTIRIYTAEGMLQATYTVQGQVSYTIQAARENGFYLVELSNDSMKSTLRYIVK